MSHLKQRKENNCLNCNAVVHGRFCHICGQENVEVKESAGHLINHFFQDITHFDGKFFSSVKLLVRRPGFLSREYMVGRRASYLNPVRFYVFSSFLFFLIFFTFFRIEPGLVKTTVNTGNWNVSLEDIKKMDSTEFHSFAASLVENDSTMNFAYDKVKYLHYLDSIRLKSKPRIKIGPGNYETRAQYDSALAHGKKHNWLERQIVLKNFEVREKYKDDPGAMMEALIDKFVHSFPQILFVSLPIFAFLLKLLYIRRKQFYYVNHAIFTIHLFVFVFISLLVNFAIEKLGDWLHAGWLDYFNVVIVLLIFVYNLVAMRNFYQQGWGKTLLKFLILHLVNLFVVLIIFVLFLILSLFKL